VSAFFFCSNRELFHRLERIRLVVTVQGRKTALSGHFWLTSPQRDSPAENDGRVDEFQTVFDLGSKAAPLIAAGVFSSSLGIACSMMLPPLFAVTAPTELRLWLTPLWLLGVGALLGLVGLLLTWGLSFLLSRIPVWNRLVEHPRRREIVAGLAVLWFALLFGGLVAPQIASWQAAGTNTLAENLFLSSVLLLPTAWLLALACIWFSSPRTVSEVPQAIGEGALWPIFLVTCMFAAIALVGLFAVEKPRALIESLARTPYVGTSVYRATLPPTSELGAAADPEQHAVPVLFQKNELRRHEFQSTEALTADEKVSEKLDVNPPFEVPANETYRWERTASGDNPFEEDTVRQIYVRNYGSNPAELKLTVVTQPAFPEVWAIWITAGAVMGVFLLYVLQRTVMPGLSAISLATLKSELAQPLFLILMAVGIFALLLFIIIPYNTFGEDDKVLKDSGMTLIMVLCIIQAIWAASTSISDEIEGRTALTVLSKPIGRRAFIIGKYLGILWTVMVMFVILGTVFIGTVSWKPIWDSHEGSGTEPTWQLCAEGMLSVIPGLVLAFMETAVLAAVSVAISTRLSMLANFIISFSIYVLGNLTPLLVQSAVFNKLFEPVVFMAKLIAVVLPVLDHFNIQAAIAAGKSVPYDYLGWAFVYCLIYGVIALMLALVLFEDRDLA